MSLDPHLERSRQLAAEQRTPIGAPEDRTNADLRQIIHLLAQLLNEPRRAA